MSALCLYAYVSLFARYFNSEINEARVMGVPEYELLSKVPGFYAMHELRKVF